MRSNLFAILIIVFNSFCLGQAKLSIEECLQLEGFDFNEFRQADRFPKDTIVDVKNGYYEINDGRTKLLQATKFNNLDGSILIAVTGFYADMQCENYFSKFYTMSKGESILHEVDNEIVLPKLLFSDFFTDSTIVNITKRYQPRIQQKYYPEASMDDIYSEFYDIHFTLPRFGTKINASLTVCDFIPLNEVEIPKKDWNIIEQNHSSLELKYDKKKKQFIIQ